MMILKRILWGLAIFVAVLLAIGIVLALLLGRPVGRQAVVSLVNHLTADKAVSVTLEGLSGNLWSDFTLDALTVADKDGPWLTVSDTHVIWEPLMLIRQQQGIHLVSVGSIAVSRVPKSEKEPVEKPPSEMPPIPRMASVVPQKIILREITVAAPVTGMEQKLTLSGAGTLERYFVSAQSLAGTPAILGLFAGYGQNGATIRGKFTEAPGGLMGHLVRLPADTAIDGQINFSSDVETATLHDLTMHLGTTTLSAQGTMTLPGHELSAHADLDVPDVALYQNWSPQPVAGDVHIAATAAGPIQEMRFNANLDSTVLQLGDHQLSLMTATLPVTGDFTKIRLGQIDADLGAAIRGLVDAKNVDLDFSGHVQKTQIEGRITAHYDGYGLNGTGVYDRADGKYSAKLQSDAAALDKIMPKTKLKGTAALSLAAAGDNHGAKADGQAIVETTTGNSTVDFSAAMQQAYKEFTADLTGNFHHDKAVFDLTTHIAGDAEHITADPVQLSGPGVSVDGKGAWQKTARLADATAAIDVRDFAPLGALLGLDLQGSLKANALAARENGVQGADIDLQKLNYRHGDLSVALARPTKFRMLDRNATLSPAILTIAGGTVTVQGKMSPEAINGKAELKKIDLNRLSKTGLNVAMLDGLVTLSGSPAAPVINARSTIAGQSGDMPLNVALDADWRQNRLHVQGDAKMRSATLRLASNLAASLSLKPFGTTLSKNTGLDGTIAANVPLKEFNTLLWSRGHRIAGIFGGNAQLRGTVGTPQVLGRFVLDHFDYNNPASGVCLNDAHAVIDGTTKQITLRDFTARDPRGGSFNASAQLAMAAPRPVNGSLAFRNFRLFCGGLATGTLDGRIGAKGSLEVMAVTGRLSLGPLNVQIPAGRNTTNIPEVETVRIVPGAELPDALKPKSVVRLDVTLDAPARIYVRGRGLDAEFGGNLHVGGTAGAPDIRGAFASRRGRFTLLDRVMTLSRANLRFEGPIPPSPFLDVSAATDVNATTITVNLTGPATKPEFALTASPAKPQDEVLALLLFGRELKTISPFQAYQLAQATRELAGLDDGQPGLLDRARGVLGVDTLDVGTDDDNNVTVSTGKYVTDKVYVGVQQGTTPESREVTTQIELTPSVTANTTLDADGNQGVGLGWKWDY